MAKRRKKKKKTIDKNYHKDIRLSDTDKIDPIVITKRKIDKEEQIQNDDKHSIPVAKHKKSKEKQLSEGDIHSIPSLNVNKIVITKIQNRRKLLLKRRKRLNQLKSCKTKKRSKSKIYL